VAAHVLHDRLSDLALVEHAVPVLGDQAKRLAQVAIHDLFAHLLRCPVGAAVQGAGGGREREALVIGGATHLSVFRPPRRNVLPHRPAPLCPRDGGLHDLLPGQSAVLTMRVTVRAKAGGHADGLVADVVDPPAQDEPVAVTRLGLDAVCPHVGPHRAWRWRVEVDVAVEPAPQRDTATPEARDAAHHRVDHALHEGTGDGRIHRVAARLEHLRAGLGRLGLRGHDHRALSESHGASSDVRKWPDLSRPRGR
jgi:hypothetical protein